MIILGIDPGTANTGYGIIRVSCRKTGKKKTRRSTKSLKCLKFGCIKTTPVERFPRRLITLSKELRKIVKTYQPKIVAVEKLFFFKNKKTVIRVSEATGVILLVLEKMKIPIVEYSPLQVKKFLTGNGRADKKDVQNEVEKILKLNNGRIKDDAADALALALYAAHQI